MRIRFNGHRPGGRSRVSASLAFRPFLLQPSDDVEVGNIIVIGRASASYRSLSAKSRTHEELDDLIRLFRRLLGVALRPSPYHP